MSTDKIIMQPLVTTHRIIVWMFMCTPDKSTSGFKKCLYFAFLVGVLVGNVGVLFACGAFFLRYVSVDLEQSLHPVMNVGATFGVNYACIYAACFGQKQMAVIFDKLSAIYRSRE